MSSSHDARIVPYYELDENEIVECPECGWRGTEGEAGIEVYELLSDRSCPECDKMLLVVPHPTFEETRAAFA